MPLSFTVITTRSSTSLVVMLIFSGRSVARYLIELVNKFREVLKENGLQGTVRAQRAGCLDECKNGPALVIYPEGTYYGNITLDRVEEIVKMHVMQNKIVTDLELKSEKV